MRDRPVARARLAPAALHVEREPAGQVAAHLGLVGLAEQLADVVEHPGVGGRVRPGRPADGRLVDVDHLVDVLDPGDGAVQAGQALGPVDLLGQRPQQDVVDQGGLPRARHPGHGHQLAEGELDGHVLQVVLAGAVDHQVLPVARAAELGHRDRLGPGQVLAGQRVRVGQDAVGPQHRTGVDDAAAVLPRPGPHVDHVVGHLDGLLVVLDHDDRVAQVAQPLEGADQALVVALVQADGRLVEHVEHARPGRSRSGWPGGCAGPRHRTGWRPSGPGSGSRGPRRGGTASAPAPRGRPGRRSCGRGRTARARRPPRRPGRWAASTARRC